MTSELLRAVERLHIVADDRDLDQDEYIDGRLSRQSPRKPSQRDAQTLREELEQNFLTPQTSFDAEWLNKMQQYVIVVQFRISRTG